MSDFKYIVPPNEPKIIRSPGEVGIAPTITEPINNSCSFNGSNQYLSRTFTSAGSSTTATLSMWFKRGNISRTNYGDMLWHSYNTGVGNSPGNYNIFFIAGTSTGNTDRLVFHFRYNVFYSNQVFRDPSAWYHLVVNWDSSNLAQSERFRFYVNGVRGTFITDPTFSLNYSWESAFNLAIPHIIGFYFHGFDYYLDGYVAETHFIDGQALPPTAFATASNRTNTWVPKRYLGTYGTTGFNLKFNNSAALGTDSSGNNNNWTLNNMSSLNQKSDSPTNNYCTLNPLAKGSVITLANGNLNLTQANVWNGVLGTMAVSSGKWYWELTYGGGTAGIVGVATNLYDISTEPGIASTAWRYRSDDGTKRNGGGSSSSYGEPWTTNDVIGIALNMDAGEITFYKNGASQGVAFSNLLSNTVFPVVGVFQSAGATVLNFGQRPFAYPAPSGFKALCTTNLPTPVIKKPSSYMDVVTYTGTGATQTISGLGFSPDLLWTKGRNLAQSHNIFDTQRSGKRLRSDTTGAEASTTVTLDSSGFTLGTESENNNNGSTFVAWAWDEAPIAGMDIVSYTGNATSRTIAHNLGVAPKMIIVKNRNFSGATNWCVYHSSLSSPQNSVFLDVPDSQASYPNVWNSTAPTSSVFSVGTNLSSNGNGNNMIAYLFAEVEGFSKFGSYAGNGLADGPFVYCGFRPRWVMHKRTDAADTLGWLIYDSARDSFNVGKNYLVSRIPNTENFGGSTATIDFLSNGFKLRLAGNDGNATGGTYIFAAFAETPFKYANAR
jgi:hypothetical protein